MLLVQTTFGIFHGLGLIPGQGTLAWKIPWTEKPGGLQSMGSLTVGHDWATSLSFTFHFHALEKEMATHSSVLAWRISGTGEPGGLTSMGWHRVGHDWSDLAEHRVCTANICPWSWFLWQWSFSLYLFVTYYIFVGQKDHNGNIVDKGLEKM